jgi:hypothetical protein
VERLYAAADAQKVKTNSAGHPPGVRLRIGCVFRSRNVTFCRVLYTQVLEVIEFIVSR